MSEILIYGAIDGWEITPQYVMEKLSEIPKDQTPVIRINSPGGSVFDGIAIYNLLKSRGVKTIVDGVAASIASIIFLAGDEREMSEGSVLMIHNPWTFSGGDAEQLRKEADVLDSLKASLMDIYTSKTGLEESELSALMDAETWFSAEEAIEKGFATSKTDQKASQVAKFNLTRFKNYPNKGIEQPKNEVQVTEEEVQAKIDEAVAAVKEEMTAQFEKEKEQMKASFEEEKKAEEDRQDKIRSNAIAEQAEIVAKLIQEKTPLADALQALNLDLRERMKNGTPAQDQGDLSAFRSSAPAPSQGSTEGGNQVNHKEVFNSIKNPVERAKYYEAHKEAIKKGE